MLLAILFFIFPASASSCKAVLEASESSISPILRKEIEKLNPELLTSSDNQKLYVTLRAEESLWLDNAQSLPEPLIRRIVENYSSHYKIPSEAAGIKNFYLESLNSLYGRVAWDFKKQEVEKITSRSLSGPLLKTAQALMDSFFPYSSMAAVGVSAERSRDFFESKPWLDYPWKDALHITEAWLSETKGLRPAYEFLGWYEKQTALPRWTLNELERLVTALGKEARPVDCCLHNSPCAFCPSHRSILIKK